MAKFHSYFASDEGLASLIKEMAGDLKLQAMVLDHQPEYSWVEADGSICRHSDEEIQRVWAARRAVNADAVIKLKKSENERIAAANDARIQAAFGGKSTGSTGGNWFCEKG